MDENKTKLTPQTREAIALIDHLIDKSRGSYLTQAQVSTTVCGAPIEIKLIFSEWDTQETIIRAV